MEQLSAFQMTVMIFSALIVASVNLVEGQIGTPCTTSMISSIAPCANFITGSTNNGLMPSTTCCDSVRSLMITSVECACLVITANAPFQLPINQALALFLTQTCNMNEVPQCKASGSPLPAPGPAVLGSNGPTLPPIAASPLSPQVSRAMVVAEAAKYESLQSAPALAEAAAAETPEEAEAPTETPRIRPVYMTPHPSASHPSHVSLSPFVVIYIGIMVLGTY